MWKKTADITIRTVLLFSVASFGVSPATASVFPAMGLPGATRNGMSTPDGQELARIILAQSVSNPGRNDKGNNNSGNNHNGNEGNRAEQLLPVNRTLTRKIVLDIASINGECSGYDEIYRIDCLRQGIDMVVATLPENSEYRDAKRILRKASSRLSSIVATYQDTSAPKLEAPANANPRFHKRRKYTAIRREAVPQAMARAQKVVSEATTALLRSGENSERRYAHYQDISVAVNSTKVLLRSS